MSDQDEIDRYHADYDAYIKTSVAAAQQWREEYGTLSQAVRDAAPGPEKDAALFARQSFIVAKEALLPPAPVQPLALRRLR